MDLACVYVVKEHLGFYTDPIVTAVQEGEELNDVMQRALTEERCWSLGKVESMAEEGKIRCFRLHPVFPEVWRVVSSFIAGSSCRHLITSREHSELYVKVCEVLKIIEE